jgi:hypothetical protein
MTAGANGWLLKAQAEAGGALLMGEAWRSSGARVGTKCERSQVICVTLRELAHANLHRGCLASKWFPSGETMASAKNYQAKAEAQFHKTIKKAHDTKQAVSQYEVAARATDEKTAKLRALRLAKEAAEAIAAAEKAAENNGAENKSVTRAKTISKKAASRES